MAAESKRSVWLTISACLWWLCLFGSEHKHDQINKQRCSGNQPPVLQCNGSINERHEVHIFIFCFICYRNGVIIDWTTGNMAHTK